MSKNKPLIVAGLIFTAVTLIHLLRIIYHWSLTLAGHHFPMSGSVIAFIVTGALAIWMFAAAAKK